MSKQFIDLTRTASNTVMVIDAYYDSLCSMFEQDEQSRMVPVLAKRRAVRKVTDGSKIVRKRKAVKS